jgi:hypothetical protein
MALVLSLVPFGVLLVAVPFSSLQQGVVPSWSLGLVLVLVSVWVPTFV